MINRDDIVEMITRLTSQSQANRSSQNAVEQAVMGEIADRVSNVIDSQSGKKRYYFVDFIRFGFG